MINFNDIFKSSFLENVTSFSILDTVIALVIAFGIGLFITQIYKKTFNGVMYSSTFAVSLMGLCLVTTLVILAVTSNIVLSLGMVGALSIVRFRTAIKEPLDIVFLFWSIATGIVIGAGMIPLAVFGSVVIGIVLLVFVNKKSFDSPYILVTTCDNSDSETQIQNTVNSNTKKNVLKTKTVSKEGIELTLEVRLKDNNTDFINAINKLQGVRNTVLISYNGDYMG